MVYMARPGGGVRGARQHGRPQAPDPEDRDQLVRVEVTLTVDERAQLRAAAERRDMSIAGYVSWLLAHADELEQLHPDERLTLPLSA